MEKKRIMLTNREIMSVRAAILASIRNCENVMKLLYGDEVNPECFSYEEIQVMRSALDKLDHAFYLNRKEG